MAISFPPNPSIGDEYSAAGKSWTWNGSQWEGISATSGIPFGRTADRPTDALGQPFFNGDAARLELFTQNGWANIVQETPSISAIVGSYIEGDESSTITINGANFLTGATVSAISNDGVETFADVVNVISSTIIEVTLSGLDPTKEPYDVVVTNPSNLFGSIRDALAVDDIPAFITQSGTLGTYVEQSAVSVQVSAEDEEGSSLIYSISSGSLPTGLSLNSSTGEISGTPANLTTASATNNFVVAATDGNNTATRQFSVTVVDRGPTWSTSQSLGSFSKNVQYSETVQAIDDDGHSVSYSIVSGTLPTGLIINSTTGVISGTPSSSNSAIFTVRATDTITNSFSDRQFTIPNTGPVWQTSQSIDFIQNENSSIQLSAIDDSGLSISYSLVAGTLPTGIQLSSDGILSGQASDTPGTTNSFTIRALDNDGNTSDRQFSSNIAALGQQEYTSPGTYSFTVPAGVGEVSAVAVGAGGSGAHANGGGAGGGGALAYINNFNVSPGDVLQVVVGEGFRKLSSWETSGSESPYGDGIDGENSKIVFNGATILEAGGGKRGLISGGQGGLGGQVIVGTGGAGGDGGSDPYNSADPGGGGAGGYSGKGGNGCTALPGSSVNSPSNLSGSQNGAGGGGGGGGYTDRGFLVGGASGGGVGIYGEGANGTGGPDRLSAGQSVSYYQEAMGQGGSGGQTPQYASVASYNGSPVYYAAGALFGNGGGGSNDGSPGGAGGNGAVRIIWGPNRLFPSTNTQDL